MGTITLESLKAKGRRTARTDLSEVIHAALRCGLVIGRRVNIGIVSGIIIGYNIARRGRYRGCDFPLLVKTDLGVAKCSLAEVAAA
jgi:hypothetical protein